MEDSIRARCEAVLGITVLGSGCAEVERAFGLMDSAETDVRRPRLIPLGIPLEGASGLKWPLTGDTLPPLMLLLLLAEPLGRAASLSLDSEEWLPLPCEVAVGVFSCCIPAFSSSESLSMALAAAAAPKDLFQFIDPEFVRVDGTGGMVEGTRMPGGISLYGEGAPESEMVLLNWTPARSAPGLVEEEPKV